MATKWGKADYKQIKRLQEKLLKLEQADLDKFCESASKELAARLLSLVIPRTPVGQYPKDMGKKGGTLRRGWTGGKSAGAATYAQSLPIEKTAGTYTICVINPTEYAEYVEFGHRQEPGRFVPAIGKRLKKGWADGKYFLTMSEADLEQIAPSVLEKKLDALLREVFNG
jgi:hypothetical protein